MWHALTPRPVRQLMIKLVKIGADIYAVGNIITNLFYSFGPLYYLSRVQLPNHDKWALRGVFMIGLLATICAIAKCTELPKLKSTTDPTCRCRRTKQVQSEN